MIKAYSFYDTDLCRTHEFKTKELFETYVEGAHFGASEFAGDLSFYTKEDDGTILDEEREIVTNQEILSAIKHDGE